MLVEQTFRIQKKGIQLSRSKRSIFNYASSLGLTAVTMLVSIVAAPLLLRWLGEERLGAFRASSDWVGYISLLELGFGGALSPMFAAAISRQDEPRTRQVLAVGLRAYRWVTLFMVIAAAALVVALPYLVSVRPSLVADLRLGAVVACFMFLLTPLSPLRPFLEAGQRGYVVNAALLVQSLVISAVSLLLAWRGFGITGQWLAIVCGTAVYLGIIFFSAWRHLDGLPSLMFGLDTAPVSPFGMRAEGLTAVDEAVVLPPEPSEPTPAKQLWILNGPTLVLNISGRISYLTDNILIALFLGPAAIVPFQLTQRLAQIIQAQVLSVGSSTWAALAELYATGQHELFVRRAIQLTQLIFVTGLAGMLPFLAFNRSFVIRWVGVGQYAGFHLMLLAVANGLLLSLFSFWMFLFTATQNIRLIVSPVLTGGIVNLAASIVATKLLGRTGPLWGTFVSFFAVYVWWIPWLMRKTFGIPLREMVGCLVRPIVLGIAYGALLVWIGQRYPAHSWVMIASAMILGGLGFLCLAGIAVFDAGDRKAVNSFIKRFLPQSHVPSP